MTFPPFDSYLASASRLKMNAAYVKPSLANLPIRALIVIVYGQNKLTTTMWKKMKGIHIGYFFTAPFFPRWLWKCRGEHPFEKQFHICWVKWTITWSRYLMSCDQGPNTVNVGTLSAKAGVESLQGVMDINSWCSSFSVLSQTKDNTDLPYHDI